MCDVSNSSSALSSHWGSRFFIPATLIRARSHPLGAFQRTPNLRVVIVGGEEAGDGGLKA